MNYGPTDINIECAEHTIHHSRGCEIYTCTDARQSQKPQSMVSPANDIKLNQLTYKLCVSTNLVLAAVRMANR